MFMLHCTIFEGAKIYSSLKVDEGSFITIQSLTIEKLISYMLTDTCQRSDDKKNVNKNNANPSFS